MATLTIRKLDDDIYERVRAQARRNERSIEAEARSILDAGSAGAGGDAEARRRDLIERLREYQERMLAKHGPSEQDSVALIRAVRDEE